MVTGICETEQNYRKSQVTVKSVLKLSITVKSYSEPPSRKCNHAIQSALNFKQNTVQMEWLLEV